MMADHQHDQPQSGSQPVHPVVLNLAPRPDNWTGFTDEQQKYFRARVIFYGVYVPSINNVLIPHDAPLLWLQAKRERQCVPWYDFLLDPVYQLSTNAPPAWEWILKEMFEGGHPKRPTGWMQMEYMQRLHYTVAMRDMDLAQLMMLSQPFLGVKPSQGGPWAQATRRIEAPEQERLIAAAAAAGKEAAEEQRLLANPSSLPQANDGGKRRADEDLGPSERAKKTAKASAPQDERIDTAPGLPLTRPGVGTVDTLTPESDANPSSPYDQHHGVFSIFDTVALTSDSVANLSSPDDQLLWAED
jgi:hypothetical protein